MNGYLVIGLREYESLSAIPKEAILNMLSSNGGTGVKQVFKDKRTTIFWGDCREIMSAAKDSSIDSIVTDPPYELGFMGKHWDASGIAYDAEVWKQAYRILKPGGHMLVFGGTRTFHRVAVAIEDAGFEIRDSIAWCYGSGFPKSQNISKAIDKQAGLRGHEGKAFTTAGFVDHPNPNIQTTAPSVGYVQPEHISDEAKEWDGWGTALKPAFEPIILARKPIDEKTIAANVIAWGTGGLNIDSCRIEMGDEHDPNSGRWPANLVLDESQAAAMDLQESGVSRFFYTSKANKKERPESASGTKHPTVKPLDLMCWLVRLITPPGGRVFDPFAGTGTTLEAALLEGFKCVGAEQDRKYIPLIKVRVDRYHSGGSAKLVELKQKKSTKQD